MGTGYVHISYTQQTKKMSRYLDRGHRCDP